MKRINKKAVIGPVLTDASITEQLIAHSIAKGARDITTGTYISPSIRARIVMKQIESSGYKIVEI